MTILDHLQSYLGTTTYGRAMARWQDSHRTVPGSNHNCQGGMHISGSHGYSSMSLVTSIEGSSSHCMETDVNAAGLCDCLGWVFLQKVHTAKITASPKMDNIWQTHSANNHASTVGARCEPLLWRGKGFLVRAIT